MDKDKSILDKFTETLKEIANSASEALKSEEPPKVEQTNAAYMPFAAEGLVSDPVLLPPAAVQPRRKRTAKKTARKSSARKAAAKRTAPKKAPKTRTAARSKSRTATRSAAKAPAKRTTKRATKRRTAKHSAKRGRR